MRVNSNSLKSLIALLIAALLFTSSCASITSFFKGSGKKMDKAETYWANKEYALSLWKTAKVLEADPKFERAKLFLKDNYETGVEKAISQAKNAESMEDAVERFKIQYNRYNRLIMLQNVLKGLDLPIKDKKETWTWGPPEYNDYSAQLETARKGAVNALLERTETVLHEKETLTAVNDYVNDQIFGKYLKGIDSETALAKKANQRLSVIYTDFAAKYTKSTDMKKIETALEAVTEAIEFDSSNKKATQTKTALEAQVANVFLAQGKELEAEGTIKSLKGAAGKYKEGLKIAPDSTELNTALEKVRNKITNSYVQKATELQQKGDRDNLIAAVKVYEEGLSWSKNETLQNGMQEAKNYVAESYYQEALKREAKPDKKIDEVKAIAAIYEKALEWVPNYKDAEIRISNMMKAAQLTMAVSTAGMDAGLEERLAKDFIDEMESDISRSKDYKDYVVINKTINPGNISADYTVSIAAAIGKVSSKVSSFSTNKKLYWANTKEDGYVELSKAEYKTFTSTMGMVGGRKEALEAQDWYNAGATDIKVTSYTRSTSVPYTLKIWITRNSDGMQVFNKVLASNKTLGVDSDSYKKASTSSRGAFFTNKAQNFNSRNTSFGPEISQSKATSEAISEMMPSLEKQIDTILKKAIADRDK